MINCRICQGELSLIYDFGQMPLANSLLTTQDEPENYYPLKFCTCTKCGTLQIGDNLKSTDVFTDSYPYFSSMGKSYVQQCAEWAKEYRAKHNPPRVLEVGANDGYMLRNFNDLVHLGYEPTKGPCLQAQHNGLRVINEFFGTNTAPLQKYDLIICNNAIGHVPDPNDIVLGMKECLSDEGQIVVEIPNADNLFSDCQFDTIYHEHMIYYNRRSMTHLFSRHGLGLVYSEAIPSHGGSMRYYFKHQYDSDASLDSPISINAEVKHFRYNIDQEKMIWKELFLRWKEQGKKIAAFGAAAKGSSFFNYMGLTFEDVSFVVDETPAKQGKFLPGSRIPIFGMDELFTQRPDIILVTPWNFFAEIAKKLDFSREWGAHLVSRYDYFDNTTAPITKPTVNVSIDQSSVLL